MWDTKRYFVIHLLNKTYYLSITRPFLRRENQPKHHRVPVALTMMTTTTTTTEMNVRISQRHADSVSFTLDADWGTFERIVTLWACLAIFNAMNRMVSRWPKIHSILKRAQYNDWFPVGWVCSSSLHWPSQPLGTEQATRLEKREKKAIVCVCCRCCLNESRLPNNILTTGEWWRTHTTAKIMWIEVGILLMDSIPGDFVCYSMVAARRLLTRH